MEFLNECLVAVDDSTGQVIWSTTTQTALLDLLGETILSSRSTANEWSWERSNTMFVKLLPTKAVPQIVADVITPDATRSQTLAVFLVMPDDDSARVEPNEVTVLVIANL